MDERKNQSGFSLIEVLISLVILAVGLMALAQLQVAAIRGIAFARHMTAATQLAERNIEWLRSMPYDATDPSPVVKDENDVAITDQAGKSIFLDDSQGPANPASLQDALPTANWLIHPDNPVNERGEPAGTSEMRYYIRWRVTRSGPGVAHFTPPGPGQMIIELEVIWWEGGDEPSSINLNLSPASFRSAGAHMVRLETLRQLGV